MLQKPRGTRDILPGEMKERRQIESGMRDAVERWGYGEICTPTFEHLELFTTKSGEGIEQEMYAFEDKGGRRLTLRPEVTASVLRSYVNEGRNLPKPIRWYYVADCFRYERPQKGRYRQFWQFGIELIGADTAPADAEAIMVADDLLSSSGLEFKMHVGHLAPMKHLLSGISFEDQRKVMACIDKKDFGALEAVLDGFGLGNLNDDLVALTGCSDIDEMEEITGSIPEMERIRDVFGILDSAGTGYTADFGIARGLDYYTGTVFEAFAENLGAENQVLGGGTYRLAKLFGGDDAPSCGFAIGFDRVMVSLGETEKKKEPLVAVISTPETHGHAFSVAKITREHGIRTVVNLSGKGMGAQLSHAARNAEFAAIVGEREAESGMVSLKNLATGEQKEVSPEDVASEVKKFGSC